MIKQLKYSKKIPSNSNWLLPVVRWPLLNPRCQCKPTKNQKNQVKTIIFCTLFYNSFVSIKQSAVALLSTNLLLQPFQSTKWTIKASNTYFFADALHYYLKVGQDFFSARHFHKNLWELSRWKVCFSFTIFELFSVTMWVWMGNVKSKKITLSYRDICLEIPLHTICLLL